MVDRLNFQAPIVTSRDAPSVNLDTGVASLMQNIEGLSMTIGEIGGRRMIEEATMKAKQEGLKAGREQGIEFQPVQKTGAFWRQYNASGLHGASVQMEMDTRKAMNDIAVKNAANPIGMKNSFDAYRKEYGNALDENMQLAFDQNFQALEQSYIQKAITEQRQAQQDQAAADAFKLEQDMLEGVEIVAPSMFMPGDEGEAAQLNLQQSRSSYIQFLSRNGPQGEFNVGGFKAAPDASRSGAFSALEIQKKIQEYDNKVMSAAVRGDFMRRFQEGDGIEAYQAWAKGEYFIEQTNVDGKVTKVNILDEMLNTEVDKVTSFMKAQLTTSFQFEERERKLQDRQDQDWIDTQKKAIAFETDPMKSEAMMDQFEEDPRSNFEDIEELREFNLKKGTGAQTDPVIRSETMMGIVEGNITRLSQLPEDGLSDEDRLKAAEMIEARKSKNHWSKSNRYNLANDFLTASLAPQAPSGIVNFGATESQKSLELLSKARTILINAGFEAEQAGTLPTNMELPEEGTFDPYMKAQQIVKEFQEEKNRNDALATERNARRSELRKIIASPESTKSEIEAAKEEMMNLAQ